LLTLEALGVKKSGELTIPAIAVKLNKEGLLTDEDTRQQLQALADRLIEAIRYKSVD
jgi:hypothetical protein